MFSHPKNWCIHWNSDRCLCLWLIFSSYVLETFFDNIKAANLEIILKLAIFTVNKQKKQITIHYAYFIQ